MVIKAKENAIVYYLDNKRFRLQRHLLLQVFILVFTSDVLFDIPGIPKFTINRCFAWLSYFFTLNFMVYLNAYIFIPRYFFMAKYVKYALCVVVLLIVQFFMIALIEIYFCTPDLEGYLTYQSLSVAHKIFNVFTSIFSLALSLVGVTAFMLFREWLKENQRADDLEATTLATELKFLKSQINPHFLFNTINNANILIDDEPKIASGILIQLDDLLKYQFEKSQKEKVSLSDDIRFLTDYLELEKVRRDQFEFTISTCKNTNKIMVAPLLFIPFVENAVKHNPDSSGLSFVNLTFTLENESLIFVCENSKPKDPVQREVGGIGLANISRRLDLLYGNNYSLVKDETEQKYIVKLILKL